MIYNSIEEFVKLNQSRPCAMVSRNYEIHKARAGGSTLEQIAIKFGMSKRMIIQILQKK